jgi:hypothetical protein
MIAASTAALKLTPLLPGSSTIKAAASVAIQKFRNREVRLVAFANIVGVFVVLVVR